MKKELLLLLLFMMSACRVAAQHFEVRSFRLLQNDISAWVDPVKDLNKEACALIKVPNGQSFVFTTPLGVVKRLEKVGETWLYVPNGTVTLTIKHPTLGILRNYELGDALESRLAYELTIALLPLADRPTKGDMSPTTPATDGQKGPQQIATRIMYVEKRGKKRPKEPLKGWVTVTAEVGASQVAPGLMAGIGRRHGFYLHAASNFVASTHQGVCDDQGKVETTGQVPFYRKGTSKAFFLASGGAMHRIAGTFYLYEGIGYGRRTLLWTTTEGVGIKNRNHSYKGIAGEMGGLWRTGRLAVSAGAETIEGRCWLGRIGVGIVF